MLCYMDDELRRIDADIDDLDDQISRLRFEVPGRLREYEDALISEITQMEEARDRLKQSRDELEEMGQRIEELQRP